MSLLYKKHRKLARYIEGLEQQTDCLQEHNTFLINEKTKLKEKNETIIKMVKGIEWDVEAICTYLEKEKDN